MRVVRGNALGARFSGSDCFEFRIRSCLQKWKLFLALGTAKVQPRSSAVEGLERAQACRGSGNKLTMNGEEVMVAFSRRRPWFQQIFGRKRPGCRFLTRTAVSAACAMSEVANDVMCHVLNIFGYRQQFGRA